MRKVLVAVVVAVGALGIVAGAFAGGGYGGGPGDDNTATPTSTSGKASSKSETYKFKATLTAGQEVPKPTGAMAGAGGTFTAKTVESSSSKTFTWKLTFHNLTGKAGAAHVHMGVKGKPGGVIIALCGPCRSGQTGTAKISSKIEDAMEQGKTYVNVHTAKNAGGEIRGQVKLVSS